MFFDQVTSNLATKTSGLLKESIHLIFADKTCIIITHDLETIFYHYAENHVEELKFRNECVVSGNEFNEFILGKFDYNLGRIYRPFLQYIR